MSQRSVRGGGRPGWDKIPSFSKKFIWGLPLCLFLSVLPFSCLFLSAQTLTQAAAAAAADWHCERCWRQSQAFHLGNFSSGMPQHFFTPSKPHLCIVVNAPPTIELEGELNYMNPVVRTVSKCCRTWKYLPWNQHFCTKIVLYRRVRGFVTYIPGWISEEVGNIKPCLEAKGADSCPGLVRPQKIPLYKCTDIQFHTRVRSKQKSKSFPEIFWNILGELTPYIEGLFSPCEGKMYLLYHPTLFILLLLLP